MLLYANLFATLKHKKNPDFPIVLVVGPMDSGKSTLSQILVNYAVRNEIHPVYVDLDPDQGDISVPGTIAAVKVNKLVSIESGFSQDGAIVYNYGNINPGHNLALYCSLISELAQQLKEHRNSGMIINTSGWVRGEGQKVIKHIAQAFEVEVIVVIDQERLYHEMSAEMPDFVQTIWVPKPDGIKWKLEDLRTKLRRERIRNYFYGVKRNLEAFHIEVITGL